MGKRARLPGFRFSADLLFQLQASGLPSPGEARHVGRSRPNTREIKSLRVDLGPLACALPPDAGCMLPFGLFVVCVGGGVLQGRRLGGLRAVLAVPSVV